MDVFAGDEEKVESARLVRNVGELLTAMELSAASRFWHVWGSRIGEKNSTISSTGKSDNSHINSYPAEYHRPVVGMMYDTMASFQVSGAESCFCRTIWSLLLTKPFFLYSRLGFLQNLWYRMVSSLFLSRLWQSAETTLNGAKLCTRSMPKVANRPMKRTMDSAKRMAGPFLKELF